MSEKRKLKRLSPQKHLKVYNINTGEQIGLLANFSTEGVMFVTNDKIQSSAKFKCRIELIEPIMGLSEIIFDTLCCWSRKNISMHWWESGYKIDANKINHELLEYLSIAFVVGKWQIPGITEVKTTPVENLRKTTRYEVRDQYPVYQQFSYHEIGKLDNLSIEGVCFITPDIIKKGSVLNCKIKLPKTIFQRDYLIIDAKCMWSSKDNKSDNFRSGFILQNVSEHDRVIILHLILNFLEKQKSEQKFCIVK